MRNKFIILLILLFVPLKIFANINVEKIYNTFIVEIEYSTINYSKVYPWIKSPGENYSQYGIIIDDSSILTQCDELPNAFSILVKYQKKQFEAKLQLIDAEINLCVLKYESKNIEKDLFAKETFPLSKDPKIKQNIKLFYFDEFNKIKWKQFSVNKYLITSDYGFTKLPVFSVSSTTNYKIGSLAFDDNGLVGIVSYFNKNELILIPVSRLDHFIFLYKEGNYKGFVPSGVILESIPEELKEFYNITENNACFINEVLVQSSVYNVLKEGDILLEIDGVKPIENCNYDDPSLGIQNFELLFSRNIKGNYRTEGDEISISFIHKNKRQQNTIKLKSFYNDYKLNYVERIPWKVYNQQPYIVLHGFVFVELSRSYLNERLGNQWRRKALELAYIYDYKKYYKSEKENDKVVIISDILPDPINTGYRDIILKPIVKINGKPIENLKQIYQTIQEEKNKLVTLELSDQKIIILDLSKTEEHQKILEKFQIPVDHYIEN